MKNDKAFTFTRLRRLSISLEPLLTLSCSGNFFTIATKTGSFFSEVARLYLKI